MSQFDTAFYISQSFWTLISFGIFAFFTKILVLDKVDFISNVKKEADENVKKKVAELELKFSSIVNRIDELTQNCEIKIDDILQKKKTVIAEIRASFEQDYNRYKEEKLNTLHKEIASYKKSVNDSYSQMLSQANIIAKENLGKIKQHYTNETIVH